MKLDLQFRAKFEEILRTNKEVLQAESCQLVDKLVDTPYRIALLAGCVHLVLPIPIEAIIAAIEKSLQAEDFIEFTYWGESYNNEIYFTIIKPLWNEHLPKTNGATKEDIEIRGTVRRECLEEYWNTDANKQAYERIANFSCFTDLLIPVSEASKFNPHIFIYNLDAWDQYLMDLTHHFIPTFIFDKKRSGKYLRFLKPLNDELDWGFEYEKNHLRKECNKYNIVDFPRLFNLILVNKQFKKTEDASSENIIKFGSICNPFFKPPCGTLFAYTSLENKEEYAPNCHRYRSTVKWENNGDGTISILNDHVYGEKIKKYAFYYMDILGYTSASYLTYIEKCLKDVIK